MTTRTLHFDAAVFDLDGVITDTARLHAQAWKELVDGYLERRAERTGDAQPPFDPARDYRRYVDGKPREEGLRSFLEARGIELPEGEAEDPPDRETVRGLAAAKDIVFQRLLRDRSADLIEGTVALARDLAAHGVRTAVASSSRNCREVLESAGIADLFEARVDGVTLGELGLAGKPRPDMFVEAARRVGAEPARTVIFEDALSGVQAGREGGFGLVTGVAAAPELRWGLREAGADLVVEMEGMGGLRVELLDAWFARREDRRPPVPREWPTFRERIRSGEPAVFLDYDGTLTPIVDRPDQAVLPPETREAVRRVADRYPTTIVSGRGREDVARLVGLDNVHYAGSHGYDIEARASGGGRTIRHQVAEEAAPAVEAVTAMLEEELAGIRGALVEPKRYTVAVHYRLVPDERVAEVEAAVDRAVASQSALRKAHGKRVFEIRPALDWDKGKAVLWLLEALELDRPGTLPIYVGDDTTDEDAFRALEDRGVGILVSRVPRPTAARYSLQDPEEVRTFLVRLAGR